MPKDRPDPLLAWIRERTEAELLAWARTLSRPALAVLLERFGTYDECECCPCGDPYCNCKPPRARKPYYLPAAVELWAHQTLFPHEYLPPPGETP